MANINVKGYKQLSEGAKGVFNYVDRKHQNEVEDKEEWMATEVKERITYLEVSFKNGERLIYYPEGSWS